MIHDLELTDRLSDFPLEKFSGLVYRATGLNADPTAASRSGGRWAPAENDEPSVAVLYTSLERDGAIAEVVSYLAEQNPMPSKPLRVHELNVSASKTLTLSRVTLLDLGVDLSRYNERDYTRTQRIGAALNFLEIDGLIAPSPRWPCDNLIIFADNLLMTETLEIKSSEEIDWQEWARSAGTFDN